MGATTFNLISLSRALVSIMPLCFILQRFISMNKILLMSFWRILFYWVSFCWVAFQWLSFIQISFCCMSLNSFSFWRIILLSVIWLNIILQSVILMRVIPRSVILLSVIPQNAMAPQKACLDCYDFVLLSKQRQV